MPGEASPAAEGEGSLRRRTAAGDGAVDGRGRSRRSGVVTWTRLLFLEAPHAAGHPVNHPRSVGSGPARPDRRRGRGRTGQCKVDRAVILADLEDFAREHRPHGRLEGSAGELTENSYMVTVACPCGVTFYRWVAPIDAAIDLALLGRFH